MREVRTKPGVIGKDRGGKDRGGWDRGGWDRGDRDRGGRDRGGRDSIRLDHIAPDRAAGAGGGADTADPGMSGPRLASGLWVSAWLRRLGLAGRAGYVLRRGDDTAGAVLIKCATLDGRAALWARQWDFTTDTTGWTLRDEDDEAAIDAILARERAADPDLWLLEVEARDGDPMLPGD